MFTTMVDEIMRETRDAINGLPSGKKPAKKAGKNNRQTDGDKARRKAKAPAQAKPSADKITTSPNGEEVFARWLS